MGFDMAGVNSALGSAIDTSGTDIASKLSAAQGGELSETQMLEMQHSLNRWSIMVNMQTNMMKAWSDGLKSITQNLR